MTGLNKVGQPVSLKLEELFEQETWTCPTAEQFNNVATKTALLALRPNNALKTTEVIIANTIMITPLFTRALLEMPNNSVVEGFFAILGATRSFDAVETAARAAASSVTHREPYVPMLERAHSILAFMWAHSLKNTHTQSLKATCASATNNAEVLEYERILTLKNIAPAHPLNGASNTAPSISHGSSTTQLDAVIVQSLQQTTTSLHKLGTTMEHIRTNSTKESEAKKPVWDKLDGIS